MPTVRECGRLVPVEDGYIGCPYCRRNKRLMRIRPDTFGRNIPAYCRVCKRELKLDIAKDESQ